MGTKHLTIMHIIQSLHYFLAILEKHFCEWMFMSDIKYRVRVLCSDYVSQLTLESLDNSCIGTKHLVVHTILTSYSYNPGSPFLYIMKQNSARPSAQIQMIRIPQRDPTTLPTKGNASAANQG